MESFSRAMVALPHLSNFFRRRRDCREERERKDHLTRFEASCAHAPFPVESWSPDVAHLGCIVLVPEWMDVAFVISIVSGSRFPRDCPLISIASPILNACQALLALFRLQKNRHGRM